MPNILCCHFCFIVLMKLKNQKINTRWFEVYPMLGITGLNYFNLSILFVCFCLHVNPEFWNEIHTGKYVSFFIPDISIYKSNTHFVLNDLTEMVSGCLEIVRTLSLYTVSMMSNVSLYCIVYWPVNTWNWKYGVICAVFAWNSFFFLPEFHGKAEN